MAYFQRADECNQLILCNICNVRVKESGLTNHKYNCSHSANHSDKFNNGGVLRRCEYDFGHIVEAAKYDLHLEFCVKHQNNLLAEFSEAKEAEQRKLAAATDDPRVATNVTGGDDHPVAQTSNEWGIKASEEPYVHEFAKLKLSNK